MQFQTPFGATQDGCPELPTPIADYQPSLRFPWLAAVVDLFSGQVVPEKKNEGGEADVFQ